MIEPVATLRDRIAAAVAAAAVEGMLVVEGTDKAAVLVVDRAVLTPVATFLRDDATLQLDFLTNLCATDWLKLAGRDAGCIEVVYHLFSVALRHGPLVVKCRTANRADDCHIPSVTPIWRGAEYQEREAFDLYGVVFDGHPDMRRILMWDEFTDFPMRKDYKPPDDYEWEPTPHDDVVHRVREHLGIHVEEEVKPPRKSP